MPTIRRLGPDDQGLATALIERVREIALARGAFHFEFDPGKLERAPS